MTPPRKPIRALLLLAALTASAQAQTTPDTTATPVKPKPRKTSKTPKSDTPTYNTSLIVLDPAHGGADNGSRLSEDTQEKTITIAFADRLRSTLQSKGFTVVLTHDSASNDTSADQRIDILNRNHPVACLLLHASPGGHGIHLFTSALTPLRPGSYAADTHAVIPYDTAQATVVSQSLRLANDLATALHASKLPLVVAQASVAPIDSITCPAVALELSPLQPFKDESTPVSDATYQQHVADSVAEALALWRTHAIPPSVPGATPASAAITTPAPKPKAKLVKPPVETPAETNPRPAPKAPVHKTPAPSAGIP